MCVQEGGRGGRREGKNRAGGDCRVVAFGRGQGGGREGGRVGRKERREGKGRDGLAKVWERRKARGK